MLAYSLQFHFGTQPIEPGVFGGIDEALLVGLLFVFLLHELVVGAICNSQHDEQEQRQGLVQFE